MKSLKTFLNNLIINDNLIKCKQSELIYLGAVKNIVKQLNSTQSDTRNIQIKNTINKIKEFEEELSRSICRLALDKKRFVQAIRLLEDKYKNLLYYRYVKGLIWHDIALHMGYSYQGVNKLHDRALCELNKHFKISL